MYCHTDRCKQGRVPCPTPHQCGLDPASLDEARTEKNLKLGALWVGVAIFALFMFALIVAPR